MEKTSMYKKAEFIVEQMGESNQLGKTAFDTSITDMVRTMVREGSLAENILDVKNLTPETKGVQIDIDEDRQYYVDAIESKGTAFETSFRASHEATFVNGKRYRIDIGMLATEESKKPEQELLTVPELVDMIKRNGSDYIIRIQDGLFMYALYRAATAGIWADPHNVEGDWSTGVVAGDFTNLNTVITKQELRCHKFIASDTLWQVMHNVDAGDVGDLAGEIWQNGYSEKKIFNMPMATTIRGGLECKIYTKTTGVGAILIAALDATTGSYAITDDAGTEIADLISTGQVVIGDYFYGVVTANYGQVVDIDSALSTIHVYPVGPFTTGDVALGWTVTNDGKCFDFALPNGEQWTRLYMTVERNFLGKIVRLGTDKSWSKWEKNIFHWMSWRNMGMGFGDIRGIAMLSVKIR